MPGNRFSGDRKDSVRHRYQQILESSNAYSRFQKILKQTVKDENFLKAFEMAEDRASGRPQQGLDITQVDDTTRPSTDVLLETVTALRAEIDSLRAGVGMEKSK